MRVGTRADEERGTVKLSVLHWSSSRKDELRESPATASQQEYVSTCGKRRTRLRDSSGEANGYSTMAAPQASSRLEMLQARFQQKQLQEKEQKLLQLYDQQQQRAYQVAQRGSSGSNGSGQGVSTVSHHHQIVTRTSSSGNATSTSQTTKVKQVFNERRQTTVKGIDRSYPLEPLDNKTRKQAISNSTSNARNNGLTVDRQSITVKRVTRADVNSNVNDGKPIVSYHEEITRESSTDGVPSIESRKTFETKEFDNENHRTHYVNGNHPDKVQVREFMDEDTIERNRMMAKLHLMQYDETMKHRVRNDLDSEEFPEEVLLIEVTDKLPKRSVSKKLSQAEARLERFKNMNAKRNNANKLSNSTTTTANKKRSDQLFPARTTSRSSGNGVTTAAATTMTTMTTRAEHFSERRSNRSSVGNANVKYGQEAFEKSKTGEAKSKKARYDIKTGTPTSSVIFHKRKADVLVDGETIYSTDGQSILSKELEKPATTISIDVYAHVPKSLSNAQQRIVGPVASSGKSKNYSNPVINDNGSSSKNHTKNRIANPSFYPKKSKNSTARYIQSKHSPSPEFVRNIEKRDSSPEFFCVESEKSATTMSLKPRPVSSDEDKYDGSAASRDFRFSRKTTPKQSPSYIKMERKIRKSSKSSETSDKESSLESKSRRGSVSPLRSTELIRGIMKTYDRQKERISTIRSPSPSIAKYDDRSKCDMTKHSPYKDSFEKSITPASKVNNRENLKMPLNKKSHVDLIRKVPFKIELKDMTNLENLRNRDRQTYSTKVIDESTPQSSPKSPKSPKSTKSFTSIEGDTEIQEITMTDQHVQYNNTISEQKERMKIKIPISENSFSTYTKSAALKSRVGPRPVSGNSVTYSVRREGKKRGSVLEPNIFRCLNKIDKVRKSKEHNRSLNEKSLNIDSKVSTRPKSSKGRSSSNEKAIVSASKRQSGGYLKAIKNESLRSRTSSPSSNEDNMTKSRSTNVSLKDITFDDSRSGSRERSTSPLYKRVLQSSREEIKNAGVKEELLRSTGLIRRVIKAQNSDKRESSSEHPVTGLRRDRSPNNDTLSITISTISQSTKTDYYGRTDSVESALRRFDSIGAESEYQDTLGHDCVDNAIRRTLSKDPIEKGLTSISSSLINTGNLRSDSEKKNVNVSILKKSPTISKKVVITPTKRPSRQAIAKGKRIAEARDSIEIARPSTKSRSPTCKRSLFQDSNLEKEIKCIRSDPKDTPLDVKGNDVPMRPMEILVKGEKLEDVDRALSVKPLRSIEDIRKSIVSTSGETTTALTQITDIDPASAVETGSAIANQILKASTSAKSEKQSRIVVGKDPVNRKRYPSVERSKSNISRSSYSRNYKKILPKCSMRVDRVTKSPSIESTNSKKSSEIDSRPVPTRRTIPPSPAKSPDILSKRTIPVKSTDSTALKKSTMKTDAANGSVLQNGLHAQERIVDRKEESEVPKKTLAFTTTPEEQTSLRKNDTMDFKSPLAKKQSVEKQQSSSATAGRPTSSSSTASSGSTTQAHISNSKGRMAMRARTPISGTPATKGSSAVKSVTNQNTTENLIPCKVCGRRFAQDRVSLHEGICSKTVQKKRKQFDTTMYRIKGTDLEPFAKKSTKKQCEKPKKPEVKSNWRKKHEEFINAIRSAKQVQAHLAAGGRLSDLPPPPVSDTSDYIQCPHCGRKFNQAAAERHIPKCEHMQHNKPSSRAPPRPRR